MSQGRKDGGSVPAVDAAERMRELLRELNRIVGNGGPLDEDLAGAPVLSRWQLIVHPHDGLPALVGHVSGHPRLGPGLIVTSPVLAIGGGATWARTVSRFYALGVPAGEVVS